MNAETEYNIKRLWDNMSHDDKAIFLSNYGFWDGFINYLYEYLPEDLREKLSLKIA
jgi:hypothetical protein